MKKELRAYLRTVRMLCPPKHRRRFIRDLQNDILQFQETTPDCDMHAIVTRFGTPAEIAASFAETHSSSRSSLSHKHLTIFLTIFVTTIALIIGLTVLALRWSDAYSDSHIQRIYTNEEDDLYENTETN